MFNKNHHEFETINKKTYVSFSFRAIFLLDVDLNQESRFDGIKPTSVRTFVYVYELPSSNKNLPILE